MNGQQAGNNEVARAIQAMNENRWSDAITDLRNAHERTPSDADIAGRLGFALSRDGRYRQAMDIFEQLHREHPQDPKWPYMVGYQHYEKKAWREAIDWFNKALTLRPGYVKVLYRKAYAHIALSQEKEAFESLTECINQWEKMTIEAQDRDRASYGKAQFQLGKLHYKNGYSLKARRHFQIAVEVYPNDHNFLYELGQCHLKNNQLDDALRELQAADRIKPGTDYIIDRMAQTYSKRGDYAKAERVYDQIPSQRRRPFISQHIGMLYIAQGLHQKALSHLEIAARKQPDNHNIHYSLGCAQEATGKIRDAHASYERAVNFRRKKYNLEFKEADEALKRMAEMLTSLPSELISSPSEDATGTSQSDEGVIESYNEARGFGFISNKSQERIFFHISSLTGQQTPRRGSTVIFSSESSPKGLRAVHVELVSR